MENTDYILSKQESERMNILKVIMCIAVLFIHSYSSAFEDFMYSSVIVNISDYISNVLLDCAVPAFILISSVLLYRKEFSWKENIKKKIRGLLIPYLIFNALWIVVMIGKAYISGTTPEYFSYGILDWIDAFLGIRGEFKPALTVLWYVRDLFLLNLLAVVVKKLIDKFPKIIFVLTLILWFSCVKSFVIHNYALVFWILGYYIVKYNIHMDILDKINMKISTATYVLCAAVAFFFRTGGVLRAFIIISILYAVIVSKHLVPMNKFFRLVLPATFFIYLTHRFVYLVIQFFYDNTLEVYKIIYFVKPVLTLLVCLITFYILRRFCPKFLSALVGGRIS